MNHMDESVVFVDLMDKLDIYMQRHQIKVEPSLAKSYAKVAISIFRSYLNTQCIELVVEKESPFSHINSTKILNVYPEESLFILTYILENYTEKRKMGRKSESSNDFSTALIQIRICCHKTKEDLTQRDFLNLVTNVSQLGAKMKMDIPKIDKKYPISKNKMLGTKKSVTGTFFGQQNTKYFKSKHNKTPMLPIPMDQLVTKTKNYLHAQEDEIIVMKCPVCKNKLTCSYETIETYLVLKKNTVTLQCKHPDSMHLYTTKPYSFDLPQHITGTNSKKDVLMYIINNKEFYGLSIHKTTTE